MYQIGKPDPMFNPVTGTARRQLANMTALSQRAEKIIATFDDYAIYDLWVGLKLENNHITIVFNCSPAMAEYVNHKIGQPVITEEGTIDYLYIHAS